MIKKVASIKKYFCFHYPEGIQVFWLNISKEPIAGVLLKKLLLKSSLFQRNPPAMEKIFDINVQVLACYFT